MIKALGILLESDIKMRSEEIEPGLAYIMGRWWAQAENAKKKFGSKSHEHMDTLERMWLGMSAMQKLLVCCPEAIHASVAFGNHYTQVYGWMRTELGESPDDVLGKW